MPLRRRLSALAVLAAFVAAQAWVVCAVICLSAGGAPRAETPHTGAGEMPMAMHGAACHTEGVAAHTPLMQQGLSPMLQAEPVAALPAGRLLSEEPVFLPQLQTRHTLSADPPPPRLA